VPIVLFIESEEGDLILTPVVTVTRMLLHREHSLACMLFTVYSGMPVNLEICCMLTAM
jgi:hypothetical protein